MSREFGSYSSGYFHQQIQTCAQDCAGSNDVLVQLWGEFLEEFYDVAYSISSSEACDSAPYDPIMKTIEKMDVLRTKLDKISIHVGPYRRVAEEAVRAHTDKKKK
jgi:hypothetical protein